MNPPSLAVGLVSLMIAMNFLIWRIFERRVLNRLTTLCIWAAITMWYTIPGLIAAGYREETPFFPIYLENSSATGEVWFEDFCTAFSLESLAICVILGGIWLFQNQRKRRTSQSQPLTNIGFQYKYSIPKFYKVVALFLFFLTLIYQATRISQDTYLQVNSTELYGSSNWVVFLVKQLAMSVTILIALYEPKRSHFLYAAFGLIILDAYFTSLGGNRIIILIPIVLALFRSLIQKENPQPTYPDVGYSGEFYSSVKPKPQKDNRFKISVLLVTVACLLWFVFIPVAQSIERVRLQDDVINWSEVVSDAFTEERDNKAALSTIFWKLDSFTGGSILVREDGYGKAGITPYIGSLFVMVPRAIIPNRPIAGTSDGTIQTFPGRLVPRSIGYKSEYLNVGVTPLHIALWHFGYVGGVVFVISGFLYLKFIDSLIDSASFSIQTLGVFSVSFPTFVTVFPAPDGALKNIVVVIFLIILLKLLSRLRRSARPNAKSEYPKPYRSRYSNSR
jgi:hypothetical protein